MYKVALDAGHGLYTAGKRCLASLDGNQTREWTLNSQICEKIQFLLQAYDGYEILRVDDVTGQTDVALSSRTNKANSWGANIYLSVHHNAGINGGSGGGIEVYVYTKVDAGTLAAQSDLYNCLIRHTGLKGNRSDGTKASDLHVLRETKMTALLAECGFMDSSTDVPIILSDTFATQVAEAYTEFIVAYGHLTQKYVAPVEPIVTTPVETAPIEVKQIYRVRLSWSDVKSQIAAFSNLDSAKQIADKNITYKVFDHDGNMIYEPVVTSGYIQTEPITDLESTTTTNATPIVSEPVISEPIPQVIEDNTAEPPTSTEIQPTNDYNNSVDKVVEEKENATQTIVEDKQTITLRNLFNAIVELIKIILKSIKS